MNTGLISKPNFIIMNLSLNNELTDKERIVENGRGSILNDTNRINRRSSNLMLVGVAVLFIAIVLLSVIYAVADKPKSSILKNSNNANNPEIIEITSSSNALVYSGKMLGVIKEIDLMEKTMTLLNVDSGEEMTYRYSGGTSILDKYDKVIAASQLSAGLMVDVYYIEDESKLVKVQISKDTWEYIGVTGLIINEGKGILSFNGQRYPLIEETVVLDKSEFITLSDILPMDYVTIRGTKDNVCVVNRTKGHGYLSLANAEDYIGGMIYVGSEIIEQITEDMNLAVREGTYSVTVTNGALAGTKELVIEKDRETVFDVFEFGQPVLNTGLVHFDITPAEATLYIDGEETKHLFPVELNYGEHEIEVSLGGYVTYHGKIVVDSTDQTFRIALPENTTSNNGGNNAGNNEDIDTDIDTELDTDDDFVDDNTSEDSDNTSEDPDTDYDDEEEVEDEEDYEEDEEEVEDEEEEPSIGGIDESRTLTISCTEGAKVYMDGDYIGTIKNGKLVTKKYIGTHTIELVLDGYSKKTYTIDLDDDGENAVLNFPSFK